MKNIDPKTVDGFGEEWARFDQSPVSTAEQLELFNAYFSIFPFGEEARSWRGFDLGCGSGRWAALVAPRVGHLICIDASVKALEVARRNLSGQRNCAFVQESVGELSMPEGSQDFGYSLGVLHHVPDTQGALDECVRKLKRGAPFLVYLYYAFDNRPVWFRFLWRLSELLRWPLSRLPFPLRSLICSAIAVIVYLPLARATRAGAALGLRTANWPLSFYRDRSFYVMRNDALDRFGTRLEQRFTRKQVCEMMMNAGLNEIRFSERPPYWCAIGYRK